MIVYPTVCARCVPRFPEKDWETIGVQGAFENLDSGFYQIYAWRIQGNLSSLDLLRVRGLCHSSNHETFKVVMCTKLWYVGETVIRIFDFDLFPSHNTDDMGN